MNKKQMRNKFHPNVRILENQMEMTERQQQGQENRCCKISGVNPKKPSFKKASPFLPLPLETYMDAKSTNNKKYRHACLAKPRHKVTSINCGKSMAHEDGQYGDTPKLIQKLNMFQ